MSDVQHNAWNMALRRELPERCYISLNATTLLSYSVSICQVSKNKMKKNVRYLFYVKNMSIKSTDWVQ